MELDDLKKSWSVLDKQLQKENIVDEKQITELIAKYQSGAKKGISYLTDFQKTSLYIGVGFILLIIFVLFTGDTVLKDLMMTVKGIVMVVFISLTLVLGFLWDMRTYRFCRKIKVAEMSTLEVIERMNTFRKWMNVEFKIVPFWIVAFFGLFYWLQDYYMQPLLSQLVFIITSFAAIGLFMFSIYKKVFKHLNEVKKNLDELKELEQ